MAQNARDAGSIPALDTRFQLTHENTMTWMVVGKQCDGRVVVVWYGVLFGINVLTIYMVISKWLMNCDSAHWW